jgi:hypothetical protein
VPHYALGLEGEEALVEAVAASLADRVVRLDGAAEVDEWVVALERGERPTAGDLVDTFLRSHLRRPVVVRVVVHDRWELVAMEASYDADGLTDSEGVPVRSRGA